MDVLKDDGLDDVLGEERELSVASMATRTGCVRWMKVHLSDDKLAEHFMDFVAVAAKDGESLSGVSYMELEGANLFIAWYLFNDGSMLDHTVEAMKFRTLVETLAMTKRAEWMKEAGIDFPSLMVPGGPGGPGGPVAGPWGG